MCRIDSVGIMVAEMRSSPYREHAPADSTSSRRMNLCLTSSFVRALASAWRCARLSAFVHAPLLLDDATPSPASTRSGVLDTAWDVALRTRSWLGPAVAALPATMVLELETLTPASTVSEPEPGAVRFAVLFARTCVAVLGSQIDTSLRTPAQPARCPSRIARCVVVAVSLWLSGASQVGLQA